MIPDEIYQTPTGERLKIVKLIGDSVSYYRCGSGEFVTHQTLAESFAQYKIVQDCFGFPVH